MRVAQFKSDVVPGQASRTLVSLALLLTFLGAGEAAAQVVQLPTFEFFTVDTSVLVPDRGGAYLGGISAARESRVSRGVPGLSKLPLAGRAFGNRGLASSRSAAGASVSATIIDHAELDRAVLAAAGEREAVGVDPLVARRAAFLAQHVARHDPPRSAAPAAAAAGAGDLDPADVAQVTAEQLRRRDSAELARREAEVRQYLQRGREAEQSGKLGAARIYYKMAARKASPELRERILTYVHTDLNPSQAEDPGSGGDSAVRGSSPELASSGVKGP